MRHFRSLLATALLIAGCTNSANEIPEGKGMISPKTLENILYEMQMADVYSLSVRKDTTESYGRKNQDSLARYYNEIFAHHGTDHASFTTTMEWYKEHPNYLDSVYQKVLNRLSADEEKAKYNIK